MTAMPHFSNSFSMNTSRRLLPLLLLAGLSLEALPPETLQERMAASEPVLVVDIRPASDFTRASIPGSINVPDRLIGRRELPRTRPIILVADGHGLVDAAAAADRLRSSGYTQVEVLEGGFAGWQAAVPVDTQGPGVSPERLPAVNYKQLVEGGEPVTLLDVRGESEASQARSTDSDPVALLSARLGGAPILRGDEEVASRALVKGAVLPPSDSIEGRASRAAAVAQAGEDSGRLLVIVADDAKVADETARRLRASGVSRFVVLIGGTQAIEREGRTGLDRMGASLNQIQPQP